MKKSERVVGVVKYLLFFALFYILDNASIGGKFLPFRFGLLFALVWCNQKVWILAPMYILAGFLSGFNLISLYSYGATAVILMLAYLIHYKANKPIKIWSLSVYALISQAVHIFLSLYGGGSIYISLVELVFGMMFMLATIKIFECVIIRGLNGRLTTAELISACTLITAVSAGLSNYSVLGMDLIKFIGAFTLLFVGLTTNTKILLLTSSSFALGSLLQSNNPLYCATFVCYGLVISVFAGHSKYTSAISLLMVEALLGYYFNIYYNFTYLSLIPTAVASVVFIFIKSKYLSDLKVQFASNVGSLTMQNVINRNRDSMYKRLTKLSEVFSEMNKVFRGMLTGGLGVEDAKKLLLNEIKLKVCANCPDKNKCFRALNTETYKALDQLLVVAFDRGRVTLLDLPPIFTGLCSKVNFIVGTINDLIGQYKSYAGIMNNIDASRILVAEQLLGVSRLMTDLSNEIKTFVDFDEGREKKIIDNLTYNNVICSDALVYQDGEDVMSATVAVRKQDALKLKIPEVVSKVCGHKMVVTNQTSSNISGYEILNLKTAPKFQLVFGTSQKTKLGSKRSGDCFSIIRMENDKYLFALCDGMGSGIKAEKSSSVAIGLVENFYRAGFDNEIVLSCINKLLSMGSEEIFSALDLCVIDARNGVADFIKLGAPYGFIKHTETTEIIETGSLPLGILQTVQPKFTNIVLQNQDVLVLCSDGITDSFDTKENLSDFINNIKTLSPQEISDSIMDRAYNLNGDTAKDDMTVLVARVIKY